MVKEYEFYKSAYCGLCKSMGKNYGVIARLSLSYDATFLAMLLLSLGENTCPKVHKERCKANPLKKCLFCFEEEENMAFAGAVSVMMMYYKLQDDINDSTLPKKTVSAILKGIGHRAYKKAKKRYPELDKIVSNCIENQNNIEASEKVTLDTAAEPTAIMLRNLLLMRTQENSFNSKVLSEFGYYIGRWIYLIDAADDVKKDKKKKNFNPFFLSELGKVYLESNEETPPKELREYCNLVLNQTIAQALNAFNLLDLHTFDSILNNTIYKGLPEIQKQVFESDEDKSS